MKKSNPLPSTKELKHFIDRTDSLPTNFNKASVRKINFDQLTHNTNINENIIPYPIPKRDDQHIYVPKSLMKSKSIDYSKNRSSKTMFSRECNLSGRNTICTT